MHLKRTINKISYIWNCRYLTLDKVRHFFTWKCKILINLRRLKTRTSIKLQVDLKNKKVCMLLMDKFFFFFGWLETAKSDQRFFQAHCEKIAQLIHVIFKQMLNHISELCCPDQKCFFGSWNYNMNKDNM